MIPRKVCCAVIFLLIWTKKSKSECEENITTPLKTHLAVNAMEHFRGNFTDVWASKHVTEMLNSSYTEILEGGFINNYVINKDGRGYSASGKIWADDDGIINIKVEGFDVPGLIFPVFASPRAIAYYSCYPKVGGAGVSVVAARRGRYPHPDTIEHVLEAKIVFRRLQEMGIPINDGVDYEPWLFSR